MVLCKDQSRNTCRNQNTLSADGFSKAFAAKVEKVRADTSTAPHPDFSPPCCSTTFNNFEPIDVNIARRLVTQAANKNCALDPAPAWIVKQFVEELSPFISCMINTHRYKVFATRKKTKGGNTSDENLQYLGSLTFDFDEISTVSSQMNLAYNPVRISELPCRMTS